MPGSFVSSFLKEPSLSGNQERCQLGLSTQCDHRTIHRLTEMKPIGDIESWLALGLIDGLGDESIRRLLVAFGSPAGILSAKAAELERLVKKKVADSIVQGVDRKKIALDSEVKFVGEYTATLDLHKEVKHKVKFIVVPA